MLEFILNSIEKVKPWYFTFLNVYASSIKGIKFWSHRFHLQNSGILQTRMDQKRNSIKMKFNNFQIQKWISQTVRTQKADKNGVICLVSSFPSSVMVLKLTKIVSFFQLFADISKKAKAVIAIYGYASQSSRFPLLENGIGYHGMT